MSRAANKGTDFEARAAAVCQRLQCSREQFLRLTRHFHLWEIEDALNGDGKVSVPVSVETSLTKAEPGNVLPFFTGYFRRA